MNLSQTLKDSFGLDGFRPLQRETVEAVLAGQSVLTVFATGGGKSLCYQLPALLLPGVTVVFSPLISLMKDQVEGTAGEAVRAVAINSQLDPAAARARLAGLARGEHRVVLVAPERLRQGFAEQLRGVPVSLVVVDEAHCVSEWGHDFRPEYRLIRGFCEAVGKPPVLALTATATPAVRRDILVQLGIPSARQFIGTCDRPNLFLAVEEVRGDGARLARVLDEVRPFAAGGRGAAIVYVSSVRYARELAGELQAQLGRPVPCYHGQLGREERERVQNAFMGGEAPIVVATNAFGMGVDKPDIRAVVHAGVPRSIEAYYQEIGRAGRDGLPSRCVMVWQPRDFQVQRFLIQRDHAERRDVERIVAALAAPAASPAGPPAAANAATGARRPSAVVRSSLVAPVPGAERTCTVPRTGGDEGWPSKVDAVLTELEVAEMVRVLQKRPDRVLVAPAARFQPAAAVARAFDVLERKHGEKLRKLASMSDFIATPRCLRAAVLNYFGEQAAPRRPCCDRCQPPTRARAVPKPIPKRGLPAPTRKATAVRAAGAQVGQPAGAPVAAESAILACLARAVRPLSRTEVARHLAGVRPSPALPASSAGTREGMSLYALRAEIDALARRGLLQLSNGTTGSVSITRAGVAALVAAHDS